MDTDRFVINIKTGDFYEDIANNVEKWFDTSNYEEDDKRLLPIGTNKKTSVSLKMGQVERLQQNFLRLEQKNMHT